MRASKVKIHNFRSFGPELTEIGIQKDLTAIIGYNSAGKTTLLEAFRKVFGIASGERNIKKGDFHVPNGQNPGELDQAELSIEIVFEFDEGDDTIADFFENMAISKPEISPYLRVRLDASWEKSPTDPEGIIESNLSFITCAEEDKEEEGHKRNFPPRQRSLLQAFYVPAIRKPSEQIRYASGSVLFRLLKRIEWSADFEENFKVKLTEINALFGEESAFGNIQTKLTELWKQYHKDLRYSDSNIIFGGGDFESILKKLEIEFSPTGTDRPYRMDELGEGYRSLFYLTLVATLLKIENDLPIEAGGKPFLTILLIEEPENHIAPHLLGRVLKNLNTLAAESNVQVVISSHTPSIIGRIDPLSIRHLRLDLENHKTVVSEIVLPDKKDEAYKFIKEAVRNYPEIYFSRLVVIGEGDSEEVIFRRLSVAYDQDFDDHFISLVPLGHRFVNHIWRLLDQLGIPHVTLLDLDRERNGGGWGRVKYAIKQLIQIGVDKKNLLTISGDKVLSDKELDAMHNWNYQTPSTIQGWLTMLESFDVFFSAPLDLDFMLLSQFPKEYKGTTPKAGGPQIPDKTKEPDKFKEKIDTAIHATLKSKSATAATYTQAEKELMIWYNYLFLGRGKPSTHILAMAQIENDELKKHLPDVLKRMFGRIKEMID